MQRILILLFFTYSISLYSQDLPISKYKKLEPAEFIAAYSLNYKIDSLNLDRVWNQEMWLLIGKKISWFVNKNNYTESKEWDKLRTSAEIQIWINNKGPYTPGFTYHIYKNYPKDKLTFTEATIDGTFKYEENLDLFNWQLSQDTTTIRGFKAQKAVCVFGGRKWTAWFSSEIPFNDGPYKFNGLPGLIVKIYDSREHYVFELIGLEVAKPDLTIKIKEKTYIETSKLKFFQAKDAIRDDIVSRVKEKGMNSHSQQVAAKNMAIRNNPIELKRK